DAHVDAKAIGREVNARIAGAVGQIDELVIGAQGVERGARLRELCGVIADLPDRGHPRRMKRGGCARDLTDLIGELTWAGAHEQRRWFALGEFRLAANDLRLALDRSQVAESARERDEL